MKWGQLSALSIYDTHLLLLPRYNTGTVCYRCSDIQNLARSVVRWAGATAAPSVVASAADTVVDWVADSVALLIAEWVVDLAVVSAVEQVSDSVVV